MIYKKLVFVFLVGFSLSTIQYVIERAYANSFEIKKVSNSQFIESTEKIRKIKRV